MKWAIPLLLFPLTANAFFGDLIMEVTYIVSPAYKELYGPVKKAPNSATTMTSSEIEYCAEDRCITVLRREITDTKQETYNW